MTAIWTYELEPDGAEPDTDEVPDDDGINDDHDYERHKEDQAWPTTG